MKKSVIIMGGGMAGLCAGALLAKRGHPVTLFEKQDKTGGYVTGFHRDGFYFDATGSFLAACLKGSEFYDIFSELGISGKLDFLPIPRIRNIYPTYELNLDYHNPAAYVDALKGKFPEYGEKLEAYAELTRKLGQEFRQFEKGPLWKKCLLPFFYPTLFKCARHSHAAILRHFFGANDEIQHGLSALPTTLPPTQLSYIFVAVLWAKVLKDGVFYPRGGMVKLTDILAQSLVDHGGVIHQDTGVQTITTRKGAVADITTSDGRTHRADWYIGAMNPYRGQSMLTGGAKLYGKMFDLDRYTVSPSAMLFYLGIKQSVLPPDWPYFVSLHTGVNPEQETEAIDQGRSDEGMHLVITTPSLLDPTLAPAGFHSMKILVHAPRSSLCKDQASAESIRVLQEKVFKVISEKTGLTLADNVVLNLSATPATLQQRTGNEEGSMYGFDAAMGQVGPRRPPNQTRIKNLLWVGHYTRPAHGIVGSSLSGSFAANIITEREGRKVRS
ncbi:MAG: NAD(P)/FAD-dependent oxidoreductase [Desulfobulbaceae bacterium]|jgi:phytoene dehydrogenase-like protein|nr:NAD(P)/FAD-dependent oxidoreductase [Desulfobulbaceae bacterium]